MDRETEQILEENLIKQLKLLGHNYVTIKDETDLIINLKTQLEKHNNILFSVRRSRILCRTMDNKINLASKQIENMRQYKKGLLQQMFC